jgi:transcription termination factor Rho
MLTTLSDWGDRASIIGVGVSLLGFALTLWGVSRSKKAAQQAKEAAESARNDIFRSDTMIELAAAMTTMEEIKRLQREGAWRILPDRYAFVRTALTSIRTGKPDLPDKHKAVLQGAVEQFRMIEGKIERALAASQSPANVPRLNEIVSDQIEHITELLGTMRSGQNG